MSNEISNIAFQPKVKHYWQPGKGNIYVCFIIIFILINTKIVDYVINFDL